MKSMLKSLMSVAAAALALTSCSNDATEEVINKGESKTLEVNATIDQTRTAMATNHIDLEWSENDEIYLYIGETATKDDVKIIKPKAADVKITGVTYKEGDNVYANYSLGNSYSKGVTEAEIKIDAQQTQSKASVFAGENLPMTAKGTIKDGSVSLTFQPFGCVLVFNVYGSPYNSNEKIKSIKFETSVGCCGYQLCDLTAAELGYAAYEKSTSATVTLTTPATIGAAKPSDTKVGENQVYMVLAPVNYGDATITVNTTIDSENIYNTYTFKTANGIDCSKNTARVVNLNLARAAVEPVIEVPTVPQRPSNEDDLPINDIVFKNFTASELGKADAGVYSDAELTQPLTDSWLTISSFANLTNGQLICHVAANESTEPRTAYIGIKCASVQAAIAVTQLAPGSIAAPDPTTADLATIVNGTTYQQHTNETWTVTCGGNNHTLGSNAKQVAKRTLNDYPAIVQAMGLTSPEKAAAVISNIALPAGYNTATLKYSKTSNPMQVGIAFSPDNVNWTKIKDFVDLSKATTSGEQTYDFPQQEGGYYAFVVTSTEDDARINECVITYSQK